MTCGDTTAQWVTPLLASTFNISLSDGGPVIATAVFTALGNLAETTFVNPTLGLRIGTWSAAEVTDFWTFSWTAGGYPRLRLTASQCSGGRVTKGFGKMFVDGTGPSVQIWGVRSLL